MKRFLSNIWNKIKDPITVSVIGNIMILICLWVGDNIFSAIGFQGIVFFFGGMIWKAKKSVIINNINY